MALQHRWIVRHVAEHDASAPRGAEYCLACRATGAIVLYGTLRECRAERRRRTSDPAVFATLPNFIAAYPDSETARECRGC